MNINRINEIIYKLAVTSIILLHLLNDAWVQSNLLCILKLYFSIINTTLYIFYIFLDTKTSEDFTDEVECIVPTISKKLSHLQTGKINQRIYESYYAATDILTVRRVQYI